MQFLSKLAILRSWSMHHSLCKFRQNSFCLSSIYVRFYELYPFRSSPFLTFLKEARFCRIEVVVYVECLYFSSYERSYKERVIKNLAAYKCLRRTEYVVRDCITLLLQRFSFVFTMYSLSKAQRAFLQVFCKNINFSRIYFSFNKNQIDWKSFDTT